MEIIQYGDPDNSGKDLKGYNQIYIRAEAYIGWGILVDITGCYEAYEKQYESVEEKQVVRFLLADRRNPASVINCAAMMRENARTSREIIPAEAWEQINDL